MERWTAGNMPSLTGKTVIVTGGNGGLGYEAALRFAQKGAQVVIACRDQAKGKAALERIRASASDAQVEAMPLDLAQLASIRAFVDSFLERPGRVDILCNNAGVMALPYRKTADGFEMQIGTNHLGHFALTSLLLGCLLEAPEPRIVTVSSQFHRAGKIAFDDLHSERRYRKWGAYAQSKLANLLFTYELQRRLAQAESLAKAVACHPGYASTDLQMAGPRMEGSSIMERLSLASNKIFAQSPASGALPTLYAATSSDVRSGDYIGPDGFGEMSGSPKKTRSSARSYDQAMAKKLWSVSEELTGENFGALSR